MLKKRHMTHNQVVPRCKEEYDNYYIYHDLMNDLYSTSRTIFDLDSLEFLTLQQIANDSTGWSSYKAQGLLCFAMEHIGIEPMTS